MAIPLRARLVERPTPHQQSAKPGQHESRLAQADPPHHFPCFVARGFSERLFCGIIQQVHQATVFTIDPAPPPAKPRQAGRQMRKYLPPTYRDAIGFSGHRSTLTVSNDTYYCLMHSGTSKPPYKKIKPPVNPKYAWGKVIAMTLRQPILAEALGMIYPMTIAVPADFYKQGGWLYVTLDPASD